MRVKIDSKVPTKLFINGNSYTIDELPHEASIPSRYFTNESSLAELITWLNENASDIWWICYHRKTVCFRDEGDVAYMKLVLG